MERCDTVTNCDDEGCSDEYCVEVAYTYGSEGQMSGDQLSTMDDCYESRRLAEKLVERYPAGADVTVYHHPDDINETVLETGLALRYMWLLAFMLPFQAVSLVLLYLLHRPPVRPCSVRMTTGPRAHLDEGGARAANHAGVAQLGQRRWV